MVYQNFIKMKKHKHFLFLFAAALLLFVGCQKDFLERKPKGQLTFDTFFENEEQAVQAVNAIYANFRSWDMCAFPWLGITDIISDDADKGSSPNDGLYLLEIDNFTFDATNSTFSASWGGTYRTIFRANTKMFSASGNSSSSPSLIVVLVFISRMSP